MIRKNIISTITSISILVIGLIGCSAIEYSNKDKAISNITTNDNKTVTSSIEGVIRKPISHVDDLTSFLNKYDCSLANDPGICYEKTRARLIQITKDLDEAEYKIYKLKRSTGVVRPN